MKPLLISSGEPAGIGPDLCVALAEYDYPVVVLGDTNVLLERAKILNKHLTLVPYHFGDPIETKPGCISYISIPCKSSVIPGTLNSENSPYVIKMLQFAMEQCEQGQFSALVTGPVHKGIINKANIPFTGHTEFLADYFKSDNVLMLLACDEMKVALLTTHLPLRSVPDAITHDLIVKMIKQLDDSLKTDYKISEPLITVAGLNPHAGESGYLGMEEIEIITPALEVLRSMGVQVQGPLSADTMFTQKSDVFVCMYHDQGLPILKYIGFNKAVNITLGLPIIRTSVDHGTALDLAGTGKADCGSMIEAVKQAAHMAENRKG